MQTPCRVGILGAELQMSLPRNVPSDDERREMAVFRKLPIN